jgi:hypothetical protein
MSSKKKSWAEKLLSGKPHISILEKPFSGLSIGCKLLISSPLEIHQYIQTQIPAGSTLSPAQLRENLARLHQADATCPVSTGIFLRIVAENACDELEQGKSINQVCPFWRVVAPQSTTAKKLRVDSKWLEAVCAAETAS